MNPQPALSSDHVTAPAAIASGCSSSNVDTGRCSRWILLALMILGPLALQASAVWASLGFVENRGQMDVSVHYFAPLGNATAYFTDDGIVFDLRSPSDGPREVAMGGLRSLSDGPGKVAMGGLRSLSDGPGKVAMGYRSRPPASLIAEDRFIQGHAIRLQFRNPSEWSFAPSQERATRLHYFLQDAARSNDPIPSHPTSPSSNSAHPIPSSPIFPGPTSARVYEELTLCGVWPGVDLVFSTDGNTLIYETRLQPTADASSISMEWIGAQIGDPIGTAPNPVDWVGARIDDPIGAARNPMEDRVGAQIDDPLAAARNPMDWDSRPRDEANRAANGRVVERDDVPIVLVDTAAGRLRAFQQATYGWIEALCPARGDTDSQRASEPRMGHAAAASSEPHAILRTASGMQTRPRVSSPVPAESDSRGSALHWSSFLGGSSDEIGWCLALDSEENVVVTGLTLSVGFPSTVGAYDTSYNQFGDVFVAKLSADGSDLLWATFLGGTGGTYLDYGYAVTLDDQDRPVIVGYTGSADFPTTVGAYDRTHNGGVDAFVAKFAADGSSLLFSTFVGDVDHDIAYSVALDGANNPVVSGRTLSPSFPTTIGAYDRTPNGEEDGFVMKLRNDGQALLWSTLIGGSLYDGADVVQMDSDDRAMVVGYTASFDFPTTSGAHDPDWNGGLYDAFAIKLEGDGSELLWSTYLGGSDTDFGNGLVLDSNDNPVIVGETGSFDFPVTGSAYDDSFNGADDAYVAKLSSSTGTLMWSTFLGGTEPFYETAFGVDVDALGRVVVCGTTPATDFPTVPGGYDTSHNGGQDVFVSLLASDGSELLASTFLGASGTDYAWFARFAANGEVVLTGDTGSTDFPTTPGAFDPEYNGSDQDVWVARLELTGNPSDVPAAEIVEVAWLRVNPNPATGTVHFSMPEATTGTITIVDAGGRVVGRSHLVDATRFDWSATHDTGGAGGAGSSNGAVPAGVYLAILDAGSRSTTTRFLLLR